MSDDASLRAHLARILDWEDAHASFDRAVAGLPARLRGTAPEGWAHSAWQLLEHLRICQHDILDFCRNPKYVEMAMEDYWPPSAKPPSPKAWSASVAAIRRDVAALKRLGFRSEDVYTTLENRMKCGIGKCGRCNVGNVYVCKEGPVFTAAEVEAMPREL